MDDAELYRKTCKPCQGGTPPLDEKEIGLLSSQLHKDWKVHNGHHLEREYAFMNFKQALEFTNKVGMLAEAEGHHPDIYLSWGKVKISLWTHKINGLAESDFILAAKIDRLTS